MSAAGLSINVQKCKHKGTLQLDFFAPQKVLHNNICCCSGRDEPSKSQNQSCECRDDGANQTNESHSKISISAKVDLNLHSCCNNGMNHDEATMVSKYHSTNNAECSPVQAKCCSKYDISIAQISQVIVAEKVKMNFEEFANSSYLISIMQYDFINYDKHKIKVIHFPLKGPIDFIISYIHNTSQPDDESDIPSSFIC